MDPISAISKQNCKHKESLCGSFWDHIEIETETINKMTNCKTKYVYTVPLTALEVDFLSNLKIVCCFVRGTVYTKCVYTVPLTALDLDFLSNLKIVCYFVRGTVYTKCVYTVLLTALEVDFLSNLKKICRVV